ncbi:hypothetical protein Tco_1502293 [Tanacetum coccineum]
MKTQVSSSALEALLENKSLDLNKSSESSLRSSSESRRKTHYKLKRISASEEKNQDQDDRVNDGAFAHPCMNIVNLELVSEDPKTGCDQKRDTFWYKIQNVYNTEAKKKGFTERTKNMLTGKWTPMNTSVLKFNQLVQETAVHSGENDDDHINRLLGTDEEPEHFGDDDLSRPPGLQRLAKSQRMSSNSTASSGSNPAAYQEFTAEQYELDRKAKMTVLERESEDRRRLIQSQRIAEDMRVLQIDTRGMDAADAAIINAQKARIRAAYPPPN